MVTLMSVFVNFTNIHLAILNAIFFMKLITELLIDYKFC